MKLKSFNYLTGLLIFSLFSPLLGEEKIDIWKEKRDSSSELIQKEKKDPQIKDSQSFSKPVKTIEKIKIQESSSIKSDNQKIYGIYEPASYDFDLNMWSTTKAEDV